MRLEPRTPYTPPPVPRLYREVHELDSKKSGLPVLIVTMFITLGFILGLIVSSIPQ